MVPPRRIVPFLLFLGGAGWLLFPAGGTCGAPKSPPPPPTAAGNFFIREKVADLKTFQQSFRKLRPNFKTAGFSFYSLHRDLKAPSYLILTLKCQDLRKGGRFLRSKAYRSAMKAAGVRDAVVWSGADILPRRYGNLPPPPAGIVIARNDLKSFDYWLAFYRDEHNPAHGGKNRDKQAGYHAEWRHYKAGNYSIHRGLGPHDTAYVAHEASDVSLAPAFMNSPPMEAMKGPMGITRFRVWYGVNLQEGSFLGDASNSRASKP